MTRTIFLISAITVLVIIGVGGVNWALEPQYPSKVLAEKPPTNTPKPPPGSTPTPVPRAFVTDLIDPSAPTLLINTEDGTVIKEYAGSVEIFGHLPTAATWTGAATARRFGSGRGGRGNGLVPAQVDGWWFETERA